MKKFTQITNALRIPNNLDFNFFPIKYANTIDNIPTMRLEILKYMNSSLNSKNILKK